MVNGRAGVTGQVRAKGRDEGREEQLALVIQTPRLTKAKKLVWQSSRLAPFVCEFVDIIDPFSTPGLYPSTHYGSVTV